MEAAPEYAIDDPAEFTEDESVMLEYLSTYLDPCEEEFGDDLAFEVLEFLATDAFDLESRRLHPVPRADLIEAFAAPGDPMPVPVAEMDAALAFLAERGLVELADEEVRVPQRFAPKAEGLGTDDTLDE